MNVFPRDATGRRNAFFAEDGIDQLISIVLELSTELWTVRERLYVLEAAATAQGIELRRHVEEYRLNPDEQAELAAMRSRMLNEIFRTLGRDHRPVREAVQEADRK